MNRRFREIINNIEDTSDNIFITGKAGTGKSTLLNFFKARTKKNIAILAPTGVAALNVEGQTIHSFFKLKIGGDISHIKKVYGSQAEIYKKLDTLIIDEISMVRADILDMIDRFLRINGPKINIPFGGVQMIFVGDLLQLPPVLNDAEKDVFLSVYETPHFFSSSIWKETIFKIEELVEIFRQKDKTFIDILDALRENKVSDLQLRTLNAQTKAELSDGFHISLVTTNQRADAINNQELDKLKTRENKYLGEITDDFQEKNTPTAIELKLKIGSQVMMLNNDRKKRWVNGDIAQITDLHDTSVEVMLENGNKYEIHPFTWESRRFILDEETNKIKSEISGTFTQLPVRLAWAVTIHKGQGKTFDRATIDLGYGAFAPGQAYVAFSRVKSLEGLSLTRPVRRSDILTDETVINFMRSIKTTLL